MEEVEEVKDEVKEVEEVKADTNLDLMKRLEALEKN